MVKTFLIYGIHRRFELAERHARELKRANKAERVEIVARRNRFGRFSNRGTHYTFEVTPKPDRVEYVLHFDYGTKRKKKGKSIIRFQLHIIGPQDATDHEAIAAGIAFELGVQKVEGWKFRLITWGHPPKPATNTWTNEQWLQDLYSSAEAVGKKSVARRIAIHKNRSVKK